MVPAHCPELEALESISGWLYKVARNKITDNFRKKKNELIDDLDFSGQEGGFQNMLSAENDTPETEQLRQLFREELLIALDEPPEKQREVFILNEMEELTLQEIAGLQQENLKTVISRKRYAVQHLRSRLEFIYNDLLNY